MSKIVKRDPIVAARLKKTVQKTGKTKDFVYKVLRCDRNSELVMQVYMTLQEEEEEVFKRLMHQQVNKLVPIPTIKRKVAKKHGESSRKQTKKSENP